MRSMLSRRQVVKTLGSLGGVLAANRLALGEDVAQQPQGPPSTVTTPPRDFGPNAPPTTYFTDPDIVTLDPAFGGLIQRNSAITRLWTGGLWCEGPAWSSAGGCTRRQDSH